MAKHFELTEESREYEGRTVYRIRALVDLPHHNVKAGDLGGFVSGTHNLRDEAWVADEAIVCDRAALYGRALAKDNAVVEESAGAFSNAIISNHGRMHGYSTLEGNAQIKGMATMGGDARMDGEATASGNAWLFGSALACGRAVITGNASMGGRSNACDNSYIAGYANMKDHAMAFGDAHVIKMAYLDGVANVGGGAVVTRPNDTVTIAPLGDDLIPITIAPTESGVMVYTDTDSIKLSELEEYLRPKVGIEEEVIEALVALFNVKAKILKQSQ